MTDERIKTALKPYFESVKINSTKVMAQGKENTSILVEGNFGKIVVRIWGEAHAYMGPRQQGDIVSELAFMQFCRDHHFRVPQVYVSRNGRQVETLPDGAQYAIMGYVEGESPANFTSAMICEVAATMAGLHNAVAGFTFPFKRSWPGTLIEMTNDRIRQFEVVVCDLGDASHEALKRIIARYKEQHQQSEAVLSLLPGGVIHGDIMRENIKFKNEKLEGIFDFDDCRESYFLEDIAKALLFEFESPQHCLFGKDGRGAATFLNAYNVVRSLTEAEKGMLPLFFKARFIFQMIGYYAKVNKDKEYMGRISQSMYRYKENKAFFEKKLLMSRQLEKEQL